MWITRSRRAEPAALRAVGLSTPRHHAVWTPARELWARQGHCRWHLWLEKNQQISTACIMLKITLLCAGCTFCPDYERYERMTSPSPSNGTAIQSASLKTPTQNLCAIWGAAINILKRFRWKRVEGCPPADKQMTIWVENGFKCYQVLAKPQSFLSEDSSQPAGRAMQGNTTPRNRIWFTSNRQGIIGAFLHLKAVLIVQL